MRRLAALLAMAVLVVGCAAGEDGARATELLAEAKAAEAKLGSATWGLEVSFEMDGQSMRFVVEGGDVRKGRRAGEGFFRARIEGVPGLPVGEIVAIVQNGQMQIGMNGSWQTMPMPQTLPDGEAQALAAGLVHRLAGAVESVQVTENEIVAGQPLTTVAGVIDTQALFEAFADLAGLADLPGAEAFDAGEITKSLSDIEVTLVLSEPSHLLRAAFVDFRVEDAEVRLVYRLTGVDVPVTLPRR
jgi:hypothetical protein